MEHRLIINIIIEGKETNLAMDLSSLDDSVNILFKLFKFLNVRPKNKSAISDVCSKVVDKAIGKVVSEPTKPLHDRQFQRTTFSYDQCRLTFAVK